LNKLNLLTYLELLIIYLFLTNFFSYHILKNRTLKRRVWDLNICCGKTDGGGINVDIKKHKDIPNFVLIKNIYHLPFKDKEFKYILCSHTIEHVDEPIKFYKELRRIGQNIVIVVPPLWDISASIMNILEHRWIFLTLRKEHIELPKFVPLPFAKRFQKLFCQKITA
jgi:SAM-dependent methyltransferase